MTADIGIDVAAVGRAFGDVRAVRSASLEVRHGSVTGLIGPNGSGKTTLMLMLATLLRPDSGTIRINGADPTTDPAAVRSRIGWMPDVLGSWASLSVRDTLVATGRMYRMTRTEASRRAAELIDEVGLDELADRPTRVLSRGQKQRLSLARSLVHSPDVLLLDEPASGLDPAARIDLRDQIRRLAAGGAAVLVSSHVLAELDEFADEAVYLDRGETASREAIAGARTSARDWRIRSLDPALLNSALADIGDGAVTDALGTTVSVSGDTAAAALLTRLVGAGVPITHFAPVVGDLEHTFLDLSGRNTPGGNRG